jgi:hypothetical protein
MTSTSGFGILATYLEGPRCGDHALKSGWEPADGDHAVVSVAWTLSA